MKMNRGTIKVDRYRGGNERIDAYLTLDPLEEGLAMYRVNGPRGIRMMIVDESLTEAAVREEYVNRYGDEDVEEDIE